MRLPASAVPCAACESASCAEVLTALSFEFFTAGLSPSMAVWRAPPRAFRLSNDRYAVFMISCFGDHEPREAAIWVDLGTLWSHPYPILVPVFASWQEVRRKIYVNIPDDYQMAVDGILWPGERRFFANGEVLQVRQHTTSFLSLPLYLFAERLNGLALLQPSFGPPTHQWTEEQRRNPRLAFERHFRRIFDRAGPLCDVSGPEDCIILCVQNWGAFKLSLHTRLPPAASDVQDFYEAHMAWRCGPGVVEDLKFVWNDMCLFTVRDASSPTSFWLHLAPEMLDCWELRSYEDLSQVPTWPGYVLYAVDVRGNFGLVTRQRASQAEICQEGSRIGSLPVRPPYPPPVPASSSSSTSSSTDSSDSALYELFGTPPSSSLSEEETHGFLQTFAVRLRQAHSPSSEQGPPPAPILQVWDTFGFCTIDGFHATASAEEVQGLLGDAHVPVLYISRS